jgi:Histidine kinase-, DNA gyrase B-, and HSP90-like ATPase
MAAVPVLERTTFRTSRLLEFCSRKELVAQTGHEPEAWPLVVLKELVDNALDACEEAGVAPEIGVQVEPRAITVADNGPGMPPETITNILDFSSRVSSREAYVARLVREDHPSSPGSSESSSSTAWPRSCLTRTRCYLPTAGALLPATSRRDFAARSTRRNGRQPKHPCRTISPIWLRPGYEAIGRSRGTKLSSGWQCSVSIRV